MTNLNPYAYDPRFPSISNSPSGAAASRLTAIAPAAAPHHSNPCEVKAPAESGRAAANHLRDHPQVQAACAAAVAEYRAQLRAEREVEDAAAADALALEIVRSADAYEGKTSAAPVSFNYVSEAAATPVFMTAAEAAQAIVAAADRVDAARAPEASGVTSDMTADQVAALIVASADRAEGRGA